jgi:hypothetical protein
MPMENYYSYEFNLTVDSLIRRSYRNLLERNLNISSGIFARILFVGTFLRLNATAIAIGKFRNIALFAYTAFFVSPARTLSLRRVMIFTTREAISGIQEMFEFGIRIGTFSILKTKTPNFF